MTLEMRGEPLEDPWRLVLGSELCERLPSGTRRPVERVFAVDTYPDGGDEFSMGAALHHEVIGGLEGKSQHILPTTGRAGREEIFVEPMDTPRSVRGLLEPGFDLILELRDPGGVHHRT